MSKRPENRNSLKTLKHRNRTMVLSHMRTRGSVSVNEIARETGLSKMTVHKIIAYYLENGMITLTGKGTSTEEGGKRPNLFAFNPNCRFIFGLKLGDGTLCASIANLNGEISAKTETVLGDESFESTIDKAKSDFDEFVSANGLLSKNCIAIVAGFVGVVDAKSGVCLSAYRRPSWGTHIPLREALAKHFPPHIRIYVNSLWRYFAIGEVLAARDGERRRFFLLGNSGDNISGGLVENGKLLTGVNGFAGEVGHMRVTNDPKEKCVCGGIGCLQVMTVPSRLESEARRRRSEYPESSIYSGLDGGDASFRNIFDASNSGDPLARQIMDGAVEHFTVAINNIAQICDPETVVFYGDYTDAGGYFLDQLNEKAGRMATLNRGKHTQIEYSSIGKDWDLTGAANQVIDAMLV